MDMKKFDHASTELREITDRIKNSQRFGQPLPLSTTVGWAAKLESVAVKFNKAFAAVDDPARNHHLNELKIRINRLNEIGAGSFKSLASEMIFHLEKLELASIEPVAPVSDKASTGLVKGFEVKTSYA